MGPGPGGRGKSPGTGTFVALGGADGAVSSVDSTGARVTVPEATVGGFVSSGPVEAPGEWRSISTSEAVLIASDMRLPSESRCPSRVP